MTCQYDLCSGWWWHVSRCVDRCPWVERDIVYHLGSFSEALQNAWVSEWIIVIIIRHNWGNDGAVRKTHTRRVKRCYDKTTYVITCSGWPVGKNCFISRASWEASALSRQPRAKRQPWKRREIKRFKMCDWVFGLTSLWPGVVKVGWEQVAQKINALSKAGQERGAEAEITVANTRRSGRYKALESLVSIDVGLWVI